MLPVLKVQLVIKVLLDLLVLQASKESQAPQQHKVLLEQQDQKVLPGQQVQQVQAQLVLLEKQVLQDQTVLQVLPDLQDQPGLVE